MTLSEFVRGVSRNLLYKQRKREAAVKANNQVANKIAQKKGLKIVIYVDKFQNIAEFTDPDYFQKKLRSHWQ